MNVLNNENLNVLIQERQGPCLSVFTPTHRRWNELSQDMLRFKNIIKETEKKLSESGMSAGQIEKFLQPVYKISDDREFWNHQQDGLAIYVAPDEFYTLRLPFRFKEKIFLNKKFYTKDLLPVFNGDRDFYVLALDVHNIRMFRGYHYSVREINMGKTPVNMDDTLGLDNDWEKKMQYRAEISTGNTHRANFHGHGVRNDATMRKRDILRFFEMVNDGVINILKNERAPLILAGVEYVIPLYKEANKYPNIYEDYLKYDTDITRDNDLHERASTLLEPYFDSQIQQELEHYGDLASSERASDKAEDIIKAAFENRVAVLFVNTDEEIWGKFDINDYSAAVHNQKEPGDEDLMDLAATQTLLHNGTIYTLDKKRIPNNRSMAAIYRF